MKKSRKTGSLYLPKFVAEGEGFEPPKPCGSPVFKTGAINHSAIPPAIGSYYTKFRCHPKVGMRCATVMLLSALSRRRRCRMAAAR